MEDVIKKAIEGDWKNPFLRNSNELHETNFMIMTLSPLFWQALFKNSKHQLLSDDKRHGTIKTWLYYAREFHWINLTEGWTAAVTYLRSVCGMK